MSNRCLKWAVMILNNLWQYLAFRGCAISKRPYLRLTCTLGRVFKASLIADSQLLHTHKHVFTVNNGSEAWVEENLVSALKRSIDGGQRLPCAKWANRPPPWALQGMTGPRANNGTKTLTCASLWNSAFHNSVLKLATTTGANPQAERHPSTSAGFVNPWPQGHIQ